MLFRIVHALIMWLDIAKGDLVKDLVFQQTLKKIQDLLIVDKLEDEMKQLTVKLTESIKQRQAALGEGSKGLSTKLPVSMKYSVIPNDNFIHNNIYYMYLHMKDSILILTMYKYLFFKK